MTALALRIWLGGSLMAATSLWSQRPQDSPDSGAPGGGSAATAVEQSKTESPRRVPEGFVGRAAGPTRRPVYLYGRVVTSAGKPPPERVVVKMDCGNGSLPQGHTDSRGRFSFQPHSAPILANLDAGADRFNVKGSANPLIMPNLSGGGWIGTSLRDCVLHVDLPGYRSERVLVKERATTGGHAVAPIILHRLDGGTGNTVSLTTASAPKAARNAYERGLRKLRRKNPAFARSAASFETAVEAYPDFAAAWAALGEARLGLQDIPGARSAFERSMTADPSYLGPYEPLMDLAFNRKDWPGLGALCDRYLALAPSSPKARFLAAVASMRLGELSRAEDLARSMMERGEAPQWPWVYVLLGMAHEERTRYQEAAELYRRFIDRGREPGTVAKIVRKLDEWEVLGYIDPMDNRPSEDGR